MQINESPKYKRVLIKLSGEVLMGEDQYGINQSVLERIASEISELNQSRVEVAVVIGGGNIFRGKGLADLGWRELRQTRWECWQL